MKLLTRSGQDWTTASAPRMPARPRRARRQTAIIDGELVVEGTGGASDFAALQADLSAGRTDRFRYYGFDLLYLDGDDLRGTARRAQGHAGGARRRRARRRSAYSEHFDEDGEVMLRDACRLSLEGLVSKRRDAAYRTGRTAPGSSRNAPTARSSSSPATCPSTVVEGPRRLARPRLPPRRQAGARRPRRHRLQPAVARDLSARLAPLRPQDPALRRAS